MGGMVEVGTG